MLASEREVTLNRVAYLMDESWLESIVDGFSKESSKVYNTTRRCSIKQASRYCDIELL